MRLIDKDALLKRLQNDPLFDLVERYGVSGVINAEPTVDAVPVIRCKDCKYYLKSDEECQLINTRLNFYETNKRWTEDSFCSWAERKQQ